MIWYKRFWIWWKSLWRKKLPTTPLSEVFTVEAPKPRKQTKEDYLAAKKQVRRKKSNHERKLGHQTFGTFRPHKRLPRFIDVGMNRGNSIHYRQQFAKQYGISK